MALKHTIAQEVFTNSILIYPHFDEDKIREFYWRRRNSFFSTLYEEKISQSSPELSYQCTILDYYSTIELVTLDYQYQKNVYSYGPVKLEPNFSSLHQTHSPKMNVQIWLTKKEKISAVLKIQRLQQDVKIQIQEENNMKIELKFSLDSTVEKAFSVEGVENNELLMNFSQNRKIMFELFKNLKCYSISGNWIKVSFETQFKRDLFLLRFLQAIGTEFAGTFKENEEQKLFRCEEVKNLKEKKNLQKQVSGLFSSEKEPISPKTPHVKKQVFNELYDVLYAPKTRSSHRISPGRDEKQIFEEMKNHDLTQSIYVDKVKYEKCKKKSIITSQNTEKAVKKEKNSLEKSKKDKLNPPTYPIKGYFHHQSVEAQQYLMLLNKTKRLEEENQQLRNQNKELKTKMKGLNGVKKQPNNQIPEFIKIISINKAIKKMTNHFEEKNRQSPKRRSDYVQRSSKERSFSPAQSLTQSAQKKRRMKSILSLQNIKK